jgi:type III pantothenate kinase
MPRHPATLVAADIGNSRIKLGRFDRTSASGGLPTPFETIELPLENRSGEFDAAPLVAWCLDHAAEDDLWRLSSVHRGAADRLLSAASVVARQHGHAWAFHPITHGEVPLAVEVDNLGRVGMDRLLAALAANRLRSPDRAAIVVDLGTAIKVDLVTAAGAFVGGAILPGLAMSARALEEQTEALPHIDVDHWTAPPRLPGKSTVPAIEAGLFWGAVGAIREVSNRYAATQPTRPDFFITGGSAPLVATVLAATGDFEVRHLPHLVLSGIALVDRAAMAEV